MLSSQIYTPARGAALGEMQRLLRDASLRLEAPPRETIILYDEERAVATASRDGDVLRYIAVDACAEGEGACALMVSALTASALKDGITELMLLTKPANKGLFASLGFYPVVATEEAVLMENAKDGLGNYLSSLPRGEGTVGAIVMNANPFTLGHLYLCEQAAARCDFLYVFVLSEERSRFSAQDRLAMAKAATAHIPKLVVCSGSRYMISSATFPMYFIKEENRAAQVRADLDVLLFAQKIAPALGITKRFVGSEPFCPVTAQYNARLGELLPAHGIELITIPRKNEISASAVRAYMDAGETEKARALVPPVSYGYIIQRYLG